MNGIWVRSQKVVVITVLILTYPLTRRNMLSPPTRHEKESDPFGTGLTKSNLALDGSQGFLIWLITESVEISGI